MYCLLQIMATGLDNNCHIFKVGDVVEYNGRIPPRTAVIDKIGYRDMGCPAKFKEFYLADVYTTDRYVCRAEDIVLLAPSDDAVIPLTQQQVKIRRQNGLYTEKRQTLTQMFPSEGNSDDDSDYKPVADPQAPKKKRYKKRHQRYSPPPFTLTQMRYVRPSSTTTTTDEDPGEGTSYELLSQNLVKELEKSFDEDEELSENLDVPVQELLSVSVLEELEKSMEEEAEDMGFEGSTQLILEELQKPFHDKDHPKC